MAGPLVPAFCIHITEHKPLLPHLVYSTHTVFLALAAVLTSLYLYSDFSHINFIYFHESFVGWDAGFFKKFPLRT
jgi:hypothetical protein